MRKHLTSLPILFLLLLHPLSARAAEPSAAAVEFFEKEVRPLLHESCLKCHGGEKTRGGLKLTSRAELLKGGDTGPAAVPGKPEQSLLIQAVHYKEDPRMPPRGKLKDREIETLVRWVQLGLPWPESGAVQPRTTVQQFHINEDQRRFWSFQPVRVVPPPAVKDVVWPRSSIDRLILAGLEARGLKPAAQADRRILIRRATFDLTGLPPTPEEIDAYLHDESAEAFPRVVERLLASPQYGERWGRHWLDVVRYADCIDGRHLGGTPDITEAWRYRDWVIDAFNRDLPYDQFIMQQLAGDLLPAPGSGEVNVQGLIATSMLAIGRWEQGEADKEKMMTDIVDDQIDVVGRAFLGLTLACARCHDHKFDPISTADYYGLAGIFFSSHVIPDPGNKAGDSLRLRIPLVSPAAVQQHNRLKQRIAELETLLKTPAGDAAEQAAALDALKTNLAPLPAAHGIQEGGVPGGPYAEIRDARIHIRGSYTRLGEVVPRRFPGILAGDQQPSITQGSGRLQLAHWIADSRNPLTARVMVNRLWQHHFGEGIVRTPSNFGKLGEPPTHPELLDFLAKSFIDSGWSVKAMHRAIMLSATYQQVSVPPTETLKADPENRLCGRMNRHRLEAEALRDSLLAVAGQLDRTMGGPATRDGNSVPIGVRSLYPDQAGRGQQGFGPRRTLYQITIRSDRSGFRPLFDIADPTAIVDRRTVSTVAPQALYLLNHPFILERTQALARRTAESKGADEPRINHLYVLLYGRPPKAEEVRIGQEFVRNCCATGLTPEKAWEQYCQILLCANEFIYID